MRPLTFCASLVILLMLSGCAGIPLPYTDYRLGRFTIESRRVETNSNCVELGTLGIVASALEAQHLAYIRTKDEDLAIKARELRNSLGPRCSVRFIRLSIPQIKTELFGDIQTITDSSKLRELGGLAFEYQNVSTMAEVHLSLHLDRASSGPKRRLVAIYSLSDDRVLHYNYSGTNNVDRKFREWPIKEFLGLAVKVGSKALFP